MGTMYCPNCGVTYSNKIDRCPACGAPAPVVRKPKLGIGTGIMLAISFVIGLAYLYQLYQRIYGGAGSDDLGVALVQVLVLPHTMSVLIAVILNGCGWAARNRGVVLAGAILYTIAIVTLPVAWQNTAIPAALCYIAFGVMGKT